jgi:Mesyanzhinovviridae bifunctional DNA primase/polymerase
MSHQKEAPRPGGYGAGAGNVSREANRNHSKAGLILQGGLPRYDEMRPYIDAGLTLVRLHKPFATRIDPKTGERVPAGKTPRDYSWQHFEYDSEQVLAECRRDGCNVGVRGNDSWLIIDVDPRNGGFESSARLFVAARIDAMATPCVETGGGGWHFYMRRDPALKFRKTLPDYPGIDFLSTPGVQAVAAGSVHPNGRYYTWRPGAPTLIDAPMISDALAAALTVETTQRPEYEAQDPISPDDLRAMLAVLDAKDYRDYSAWLAMLFSCREACGDSEEAARVFDEWSATDPSYAGKHRGILKRWRGKPHSVTRGTLFAAVRDAIAAVQAENARLLDLATADALREDE